MVRCRTHVLDKIGKEPNTDLFQFMKRPSHQRNEEEIELVFKNLGWDYSPNYYYELLLIKIIKMIIYGEAFYWFILLIKLINY